MEPLVRAAAIAAALSALIHSAEIGLPPLSADRAGSGGPAAGAAAGSVGDGAPATAGPGQSLCPPGTLPDARVCIPVPRDVLGRDELDAVENAHRDKSGRTRVYEQIPRRPDRPADYRRFRYPVPIRPDQSFVSSGYDLDLPDKDQRRGAHLKAIGHGGIDIAQKRGTEVRLVNLEHQVGDAEVLFVGELFGNSVVTRHAVKEGGRLRDYLVIYGHLDGPAPGLGAGRNVREGSLLGFVGDSGSPGDVHLHLEVRRVRDGVDASKLHAGSLAKNAKTVACDPRNVLPLTGS